MSTGVTVGVVDALVSHLPGAPRPADVPGDMREGFEMGLGECLEAAVALGARTLNVAHFLGEPRDCDLMAEAARAAGEAAAQVGVRIGLEFMPDTGVPDLGTALQIVRKADCRSVGVLFDTWHFLRSGGSLGELADLEPGHVLEIQISDRRPPAIDEVYVEMTGRLPPGEGRSPIAAIVRALRACAADAVLGVEVFTADRGDPDVTVEHLASTTRAFLADVSGS